MQLQTPTQSKRFWTSFLLKKVRIRMQEIFLKLAVSKASSSCNFFINDPYQQEKFEQ